MWELHKQQVDMMEQILQVLQHIYHLLPADKDIARPSTYKRSILPIGGVILKGLFGTASEGDLEPIKRHIRRVGHGMSVLDQGLRVQQDRLTSFIEMSIERMDSFKNLSIMQHRAISELYDELWLMYNSETQNQERLVMALRKMQHYITHL